MKIKKIIISGIGDTRNNGGWAMVTTAMRMIREISTVPVQFVILTRKTSIDQERLKSSDVEIIIRPWTKITIPKVRFIWAWACFIIMPLKALIYRLLKKKSTKNSFWKHFLESDLILDLSGDGFGPDYGNFSLMTATIPLIIAKILNKPYMFCAQSIGPFSKTIIHKIAIELLKGAATITTRERITDQILSSVKIRSNVTSTQDLAFTLKPAPQTRILELCSIEKIDPALTWVGMSISGLIGKYAFRELPGKKSKEASLQAMAEFADYIVTYHNKHILFIPHVVIDLKYTMDVIKRMKHKNKAIVVQGLYLGDELKGLIGLCEVFIGSRMHATIAALSQNIPTLTYAYNHKTVGINGQILQQGKFLIDLRKISADELLTKSKAKFDDLINKKKHIRIQLKTIISQIQEKSFLNAQYAVDLLEIAGPLKYISHFSNCTGCGTCAGVCPNNALKMKKTPQGTFRPRLSAGCNDCGICKKVCPALGMDLRKHEKELFKENAVEPEIGVIKNCYSGYAVDEEIRFKGSSGGLITAINKYLLNERLVDAILVTKNDIKNPMNTVGFWATNEDEVLESRGSKYTPVPLNVAFSQIPANAQRLAVVGLPCHLWGINLLEKEGYLKGKSIKYRFSLFCGRTPNTFAIEFILSQLRIPISEIKNIQYRGDGWPSGLKIDTHKEQFFYPSGTVWGNVLGSPYFTSSHCYRCPDFFGYLSNISFGDAWLSQYQESAKGWSLCLTRNNSEEYLLQEMMKKNLIYLEKQSTRVVKKAMSGNIKRKIYRKTVKSKMFSFAFPVYYNDKIRQENNLRYYLGEKYSYALSKIGQSKYWTNKFLSFPPNLFMKINKKILSKFLR